MFSDETKGLLKPFTAGTPFSGTKLLEVERFGGCKGVDSTIVGKVIIDKLY